VKEFEDPRDAKDALALDGTRLEGCRIAVEYSHGSKRDREDSRGGGGFKERDYGRDRDLRGGYRDRGNDFNRGPRGRSSRFSPPKNTEYRIIVENLPPGCSWQDLKDHFRSIGDVCFADVRRDREGREMGIIEFKYYDDMKLAVKKLDRSRMRGYSIDVINDYSGRSRTPSKSPSPKRTSRSPSREASKESRERSS